MAVSCLYSRAKSANNLKKEKSQFEEIIGLRKPQRMWDCGHTKSTQLSFSKDIMSDTPTEIAGPYDLRLS
jgi:hypothetical protein